MAELQKTISGCLFLLFSVHSLAVEFAGEVKLQQVFAHAAEDSVQAISIGENIALTQGNFRLLVDHQIDNWSFDFDYLLSADYSSDLSLHRSFNASANVTENYFELNDVIHETDTTLLEHRFDRAAIKYSADNWIVQVGRQALSWGNGVVFHPMDLFNPFSPDVKDSSYKPGIDAVYTQYLLPSGDDIQLLWIPRKSRLSGQEKFELQSTAVKYYGRAKSIQYDLLVADDYQQRILGVGIAGPLGDALWKLDVVSNERTDARNAISIDLNIQTSWMWGDHPVSGFVEYYRNGFAPDTVTDLTQIPDDLLMRLQRGQLFSIGQNFLASGGQLQVSPLVMTSANLIYQLDDRSQLLLFSVVYNSSQNSNLIGGLQLANGEAGSEYGGYFVDELQQLIQQTANQIYFRYEWYF